MLKPTKLGYDREGKGPLLSLKAGDIIYPIHKIELASELFWFQGKMYSDEIGLPEEAIGNVPFQGQLQVISRPKTDWWVLVEAADGKTGWTNRSDAFEHMDACE